jgi:hypothetical protein
MREKRAWTFLTGSPFELSRGNITEPAVTTMRVIPPLEPRENLSASFVSRREAVSIQHFRLKARKKLLHHRIIEAVSDTAHGARDSQFPAARGEGDSCVLLGFNQSSQHCLGFCIVTRSSPQFSLTRMRQKARARFGV